MADSGMLVVVFIVIAIVFFGVSIVLDDDRVRRDIAARGGRLIEKSWEPFGPGWFGEKNDRIYRIAYRDREGNLHSAHAKTSLLAGVYLRDDEVVSGPAVRRSTVADTTEADRLREENRRLREALARANEDASQRGGQDG